MISVQGMWIEGDIDRAVQILPAKEQMQKRKYLELGVDDWLSLPPHEIVDTIDTGVIL
jgi:hypothetical protein